MVKPEKRLPSAAEFTTDGHPDLDVRLVPDFLAEDEATRLFRRLFEGIAWRQDRIRLFGREVPIPRLQAWHGDPGASYTYSGTRLEPESWTGPLLEIRERLHARAPELHGNGIRFDSVLLNLYRDGRDRMGWHSDDEPELGPEPVIASVSLGATRTFRMRHRTRKDIPPLDLALESGSLLWMAGRTQECWQHSLPPRTGRNDPGARINLTFRRIVGAR